MCYNNCKYETINYDTGLTTCHKPYGTKCPETQAKCKECGETFYFEDLDENQLCEDCYNFLHEEDLPDEAQTNSN